MIANIPVMLDGDWRKLVGRGSIDDNGELHITIKTSDLVDDVEGLIQVGLIRGLSVSAVYERPRSADAET